MQTVAMHKVVSLNPRFEGQTVLVVEAPVMAPHHNTIYRIKKPDGPRNGKGNRQNAYKSRFSALGGAREVYGSNAADGRDFIIYQDSLGWGFIPPGGTPPPTGLTKALDAIAKIDATPSQRRDAFNELSSVIDADTGRYTGGWTDASVGEATGLPEALIAEVRVQFYGEPKPDLTPEEIDTLKGLKAEVDTIVGAHRKLADVAEGLSARIENALRGI